MLLVKRQNPSDRMKTVERHNQQFVECNNMNNLDSGETRTGEKLAASKQPKLVYSTAVG